MFGLRSVRARRRARTCAALAMLIGATLLAPPASAAPAVPAGPFGVRVFGPGDSLPPLAGLGAVAVTWRQPIGFLAGAVAPLQDSLAARVAARGGDALLWMTSGIAGSVGGLPVHWARGVAARRLVSAADTLATPMDCVVEWQPLSAPGPTPKESAAAAADDRALFELARQVLGDRGYALIDPRDTTSLPAAFRLAPPWPGGGRPSLRMHVEDDREVARDAAGRDGVRLALSGAIDWRVSDLSLWRARTSWFSPDSAPALDAALRARARRAALEMLLRRIEPWRPPADTDGDGVLDNVDREPDTPPGAQVSYQGVALDDDGDGVPNGIDRDPRSRAGSLVDQWGVPVDRDHDGVDDAHDACDDTPPGLAVDPRGCPIAVAAMEDSLLDAGHITEQSIHFETGRATLLKSSFARLDLVGQALGGLPELRFEIAGHCDDRGGDELNLSLSESRAASVLEYLLHKFPSLAREQFVARGYGKTRPLVPGVDEASRARNRRVEFVVLNPEDAKRQVQRKRFLNRGEASAADSTRR